MPMLDPRIYRTGFVAVALAAIVFAFSLTDQQGPLGTTQPPDTFNGTNAFNTMKSLADKYPNRRPGSFDDNDLATIVKTRLDKLPGFAVSTSWSSGRTVDGNRTLETVTATRAGLASGTIVIVAHRDSLASPAEADLSGTAALLELGRVLAGERLQHTLVLASVSGSAGAAGATQLARSLSGPIEGVIVLGDLAGTRTRQPVVVPWSNGQQVAPPLLRNTVGAALTAQAGLKPGGMSLGGQVARLALPLTISEQGAFGVRGLPAVLVSVSGERAPSALEPVGHGERLAAVGAGVLQAVNALDSASAVPAPAPYLLYDGKVIPAWAVRLLVLALILPVLGVTIDGLARARRRGHSISRWTVWVLSGAVPFVLALPLVFGARATGLISVAPSAPVGSDAVPLHGSGVVVMLLIALCLAVAFFALRPMMIALSGGQRKLEGSAAEGAGVAVLLVMCVTALAIWLTNPFAALLLVPALHLWMWVVDPEVRLHPVAVVAMLVIGLAPPVLVIIYYANALALGPVGVLWNGLLMVAGGHITVLTAVEWSVLLGCVASVLLIAAQSLRQPAPEQMPITVRGPITYAGPGSLGGTKSALRVRR